MDRRAFIAGGAAAAAVPAVAAAQSLDASNGQEVTLRGYLRQVTLHYFVLSPTLQKTDPKTSNYALWPSDCVRVYPKSTKVMKSSTTLVSVRGRLYRGKMKDEASGTVATVVLTDAVYG